VGFHFIVALNTFPHNKCLLNASLHDSLNININGVISVIPAINPLLATHRPMVVVLTDARLKEAPWFYFQGYQLYHSPTPNSDGGIIILIRSVIPNRLATPTFNSQPQF
jgi:hypothetical protein